MNGKFIKKCYERVLVSLKDNYTIHDIQILLEVGQPKATEVRNRCLEWCALNDIEVFSKGVPAEAFHEVTNHRFTYEKFNNIYNEAKKLALI